MTHLINDCLLRVNSPVVHRGVVALASPGTPRDCQKSSDSFFRRLRDGRRSGFFDSRESPTPSPPSRRTAAPRVAAPGFMSLASCARAALFSTATVSLFAIVYRGRPVAVQARELPITFAEPAAHGNARRRESGPLVHSENVFFTHGPQGASSSFRT